MAEKKASDLFFTSNSPVKIKIEGLIYPINKQVLNAETVRDIAYSLMSAEQLEHFQNELEIDFAISEPGVGRFRAAVFYQRGFPAMVLRYISVDTPKLEQLGLPGHAARARDAEARARADGRRHRLGQVDDARGDDQPPQRELLRPHPDDRGPGRVPAPEPQGDRQPARGRPRHALVRQGAARRDARGAGRDPDRRDPRPRDDGGGDRARRHRPPRASRRSTRTTARRRSTASSTCSRATSTRRSSSTCRSTCARSSRSAWSAAATTSASRRSR